MQVRTNYDLCNNICDYIYDTVPAEYKQPVFTNKYYALYVFLLYKIFNVKMSYCKQLVAIYSIDRIDPEHTAVVYNDVIEGIVQLDTAFDSCLSDKKSDEEAILKCALFAVADKLVQLVKGEKDEEASLDTLQHIIDYIDLVSAVFVPAAGE